MTESSGDPTAGPVEQEQDLARPPASAAEPVDPRDQPVAGGHDSGPPAQGEGAPDSQ